MKCIRDSIQIQRILLSGSFLMEMPLFQGNFVILSNMGILIFHSRGDEKFMKSEYSNISKLESCAQKYLGEENFELANKWYYRAMSPDWDYVVFIVRRAYLLALIMEEIDGQSMESRSEACFLTDSSFYSRCWELAEIYRDTHCFPKILVCEDALSHGRSINNFLECMEDGILKILNETGLDEYYNEGVVRARFARSVTISVLAKANEQLLLFDRYAMRLRSCSSCSITVLHDLSCRLSTLVSYSGLANASYVFSECISRNKFETCMEYGFTKTVYQNVVEYAHIEYVHMDDMVKAVFTLRAIPDQHNSGGYRLIPFVFMPNLGTEETNRLWRILKDILRDSMGNDGDEFVTHLDCLEELDGMRTFNEWVTLIFSHVLLKDFNQKYGIALRGKKFQKQLRALARNYNVIGLEETEIYLKKILSGINLDIDGMEDIIVRCIKEEKKICGIANKSCDSMQRMADTLEDYWYNVALNEEKRIRDALKRLYNESAGYLRRRVRGCAFTLEELLDGYDENSMDWGFSYFLQMMDAGIIGVSSYTARNIKVVGFAQFVKAGEMSLLLYPMRMMEYIPLLIEIRQLCAKFEWDWQEEVREYCRSSYSKMGTKQARKMEEFVSKLDESGQCPEEWDIYYDNRVQFLNADAGKRDNQILQIGALLDLKVKRNRHLRNFENYKNEVIFG